MSESHPYFPRAIDAELTRWADDPDRKPLLLRGARQVGKSTAVRHFGRRRFRNVVEADLFNDAPAVDIFKQFHSPRDICRQLSLYYRTPIVPGETLLFLDEIQNCPPALEKLRYFYEQMPELHLAAAGSLLEFAIAEIPSFGVGRIRSLFIYPFSFHEFLGAVGDAMLSEACRAAGPEHPLSAPIHEELLRRHKAFLLVGGMPEAVAKFADGGDLLRSQNVLADLYASFQSDFAKYRKRIPALRIQAVFEAVAAQTGGKFVYERVGVGLSNVQVKQALELLTMAGLVHPVTHTSANGIPLGAESDPKYRQMLLLDTGLFQRILGLDASQVMLADDFKTVNRGALAELAVGLELLKAGSSRSQERLYCWHREDRRGNAQIDYIVQRGTEILPVEVKAGTSGAMQSLRYFMAEKRCRRGIRVSLENFGRMGDIDIYPVYAVAQIS
jgi:predicted AAA+ superfamily ATPase